MSWWDDFTSSISRQAQGAKSAVSQTKDLGARFIAGGAENKAEVDRETQFNNNIRDAIAKIDSVPVAGKVVTKSADILLKGAMTLYENVISPLVTRPMSTAALLLDTSSPLYKKGEHEKGFQVSDIKDAYNRSAKVSTAQALTRSNLVPIVPGLASLVLQTGKINTDDINLWDDKSIKTNFDDNDIGRWFTGVGDFFAGNAAIGLAGKVAGIPIRAGVVKAGLYTKNKTVVEFTKDMNTSGTVANSHVQTLADSKDIGEITQIWQKYSTNENLISILYEAKTVNAVKDIILADKGDIAALTRLAKTAPSDLFEMAGVQQTLANTFIKTGRTHIPIGEASVQRLKDAFDHAITKDEQFVKIRQAFLDDSYNPLVGGRAYMPMEPVVGRAGFIKAGQKFDEFKGTARFRESSILETTVGGKVLTRLVKFSMRQGEGAPLGYVTFSGARASQAREELNAFLNNIKLFNNGNKRITTAPGVTEKVADIRRRMEIAFVQSGTGIKQLEALQAIDAEVGRLLMYQKGIFGEEEIANNIASYRSSIVKQAEAFQKNGYAIDHTGRRIETNPQTLSQMKDSYRFTPWDHIERDLNLEMAKASGRGKALAMQSSHAARAFFDGLNRLWTFDVLVRPMFIIKQSIAEPIISVGLAQGLEIIWKYTLPMSNRIYINTANRAKDAASRIHNGPALRAVRENIDAQTIKFSEASAIKDILQVEVENMLKGSHSPAAVKSNLASARANLKAADTLLDDIELNLRNSVKKYGIDEGLPNLAMLERRIAFVKKNSSKLSNQAIIDITNAQAAIDAYKLVIHNMATNKNVIVAADAKLADAYNAIDKLVKEQGKLFTDRANLYGKSAEYKKRYYDRNTHDVVVDGQVLVIDSFIAGDSAYAAAMRAEIANAVSAENTYLGHLAVGTRKSVLTRKVPGEPIRTSDPLYFEELAYLANRHFRNDPLMNLILQNKTFNELKKWAGTEEGISYLRNFDITDPALTASYLEDKIALMDRMFPSMTSRAAIIKRDVTSNDLEKTLANYTDQLFDIHPSSYAYGVQDGIGHTAFGNMMDGAMSAVFKSLMKPENPIREMYFSHIATKAVAEKASTLMAQGVTMTPARLNALRASAVREAVKDTERTFYTVNRQTRIMKNARLIAAFPNATVNAFARYGRLASANPIRTAQGVSNYGRAFTSFGVDENGNKTDDFNKITHILLPGTRELGKALGWRNLANDGFALNARSIGFLLNNPSPSWIAGFSIGTIMKTFPNTEEAIKDAINLAVPGTYDQWFPYGPPTNLTNMLITPWQRATYLSLVGPEGQKDYLASWNSVYNYHKTMVDMGIEKSFPSPEMIRKEVKALWGFKAAYSFASPFGVPIKSTTSPMGLASTLYFKLRDKALAEGKTMEAANNEAAQGMLFTLGPKFNVDRVSYTGSNKNLNMPATTEAYNRIFADNNELVKTLAGIDKDNISLVSLLVADLDNDPSKRSDIITGILSNPDKVLTGTSRAINDLRMTPEETERERLKSRTWTKYSLIKDVLASKITDGKSMRAHPELRAALNEIAETILKKDSPAWYNEFMLAQNGDTSYKYAKGLNTILNDNAFMTANGKTPFWQDVKSFMRIRGMFVTAYQSLPDYDPRKAKLMAAYNAVTEEYAPQWDPKLQTIIKNSFDNDTLKVVN